VADRPRTRCALRDGRQRAGGGDRIRVNAQRMTRKPTGAQPLGRAFDKPLADTLRPADEIPTASPGLWSIELVAEMPPGERERSTTWMRGPASAAAVLTTLVFAPRPCGV